MRLLALLFILLTARPCAAQERDLFHVQRSIVTFTSTAPMETIKATNTTSIGVLDRVARSFAVKIPINAFEGFNGPLQREHFNENYMDSRKWPHATFQGRIIEAIDLTVPGRYPVRAKGTLTLKDQTRERIVPCEVVVASDGIRVTAAFDVAIDDHGIRIPRIVQQKIASVVQVGVDLLFKPGEPSR